MARASELGEFFPKLTRRQPRIVDAQLRQVLGWFGALVAPAGVYLTGADFHDGALASESARKDLVALADTLLMLRRRLDPALLGPQPLAAKFT
jgi:hypothetical protein